MNKQEIINQTKKGLDRDSAFGNHTNCIRPHPTESFFHYMAKCIKCWELYQEKLPFWTEVFTKDRKCKFDILSPMENKTIEVSHSDDDIKSSKENYPNGLEIEEINAQEFVRKKIREYEVLGNE
ncbi:MAG: hypothetical protein ACOCTT_03485 [archaeon]